MWLSAVQCPWQHKFVNQRCPGHYRLVTQRCPRQHINVTQRCPWQHQKCDPALFRTSHWLTQCCPRQYRLHRLNRLVAQIFPGQLKLVTLRCPGATQTCETALSEDNTDSWLIAVQDNAHFWLSVDQKWQCCPGQTQACRSALPFTAESCDWVLFRILQTCDNNNVQNIIDMGHTLLEKFWRISLYSTDEWWRYCKV